MLLSRQLPWPKEIKLMHIWHSPFKASLIQARCSSLFTWLCARVREGTAKLPSFKKNRPSNMLLPDFYANIFCSRAGKPETHRPTCVLIHAANGLVTNSVLTRLSSSLFFCSAHQLQLYLQAKCWAIDSLRGRIWNEKWLHLKNLAPWVVVLSSFTK